MIGANGQTDMVSPAAASETKVETLSLGNDLVLHGAIEFRQGDRINGAAGRVPEAPGAYVVWGVWKRRRRRLYLGKGGCNARRSADDGLRSQILGCREDGTSAQCYFEQLIEKHGLDSIRIEWFVAVRSLNQRPRVFARARDNGDLRRLGA
jgi:hypothetical protein